MHTTDITKQPPTADVQLEPTAGPRVLDESGIVVMTSAGHCLCHLGELAFPGVMLAVKHEYQLDNAVVAMLPMLGYLLMGLGALPVGMWADRLGLARTFRGYFAAMAVTSLLIALAPNSICLVLALTLFGVALSIYHPVGLAMLSLGVPAESRGRAMGINGVAGSVGVALGPLVGLAAAQYGNWQLAYLFLATVSIVCLLLFHRLCGGSTAHLHLPRSAELAATAHAQADAPAPGSSRLHLGMICLYLAMMFGGLNYRCLVTALPPYLVGDGTALADWLQPLLVGATLLVGAVGQYYGGWAADRFGGRRVYPLLIALLVPLGLILGMLEGSVFAAVYVALFAVCLFGQQPVENSLLAERTSRGRRGFSYGTKFALTFGFGALGSLVVGMIWQELDRVGPVFWFIACSALLMFCCALFSLQRQQARA